MVDNDSQGEQLLRACKVAFVGKLGGMSRRDATKLVREHGGEVVDADDESVSMIVVGEDDLPVSHGQGGCDLVDVVSPAAREAAEQGMLDILPETQLWQRLGIIDGQQNVHRLYTAAMLAGLLGVSTTVIRRWRRRGLIVPVREVRRLAYYDFQEIATARRLAELLAAGVSAQRIEQQLDSLRRFLPGVQRPLAQLSVIVEGKHILLRQGDGLIDAGGQMRLDFDAASRDAEEAALDPTQQSTLALTGDTDDPPAASPEELVLWAAGLEEEGRLEQAAETYRAALVAGGPHAETNFLLAELLYRMEDLAGARERYYMAIEIDEDYVEARANLGCVLAEMHQPELAAAAFAGALAFHNEYPDAQYHLARTLDQLGRSDEAAHHWRTFLELAPESPWAEEARERLGVEPTFQPIIAENADGT